MNLKSLKRTGKIMTVLAIMVIALVVAAKVPVHAEDGKTVRVSTLKQLKAAINSDDADIIIFRTQAHLNIIIKQMKAAKSKTLIIDAPQTEITNKAVFKEIQILSAKKVIEKVSANNIKITGEFPEEGLEIAAKKKLESLTIRISGESSSVNYIVRKGAKIKNINFDVQDADGDVESKYNSKKRQLTLKYKDVEGFTWEKTVKYDKYGRILKNSSVTDRYAGTFNYSYEHDTNGNIIKVEGTSDDGWLGYTETLTYDGNLLVSRNCKAGTYYYEDITYKYDENGILISEEHKGEEYEDDDINPILTDYTAEYTYDKKGRVSYCKETDRVYDCINTYAYTYNSKGFLEKFEAEFREYPYMFVYKYNKAGDLIENTYIGDNGTTWTTVYVYDSLGEFLYSKEK